MLRNKKSLGIIGTLMSIIITIAMIWWFVVPAAKTAFAFFDPENTYSKSFEKFVDGIDRMTADRRMFSVKLDKESAIIGFSKGAERFECYSCGSGVRVDRPTKVFNKPDNLECRENACICLCNGEFEAGNFENLEGISEKVQVSKCKKDLVCKGLQNTDIVDKTIIHKFSDIPIIGGLVPGSDIKVQRWGNGFLFTNVVGVNGLSGKYGLDTSEGIRELYVEKIEGGFVPERGPDRIGVCNDDMMNFNEEELKLLEGACVNDYWSPK